MQFSFLIIDINEAFALIVNNLVAICIYAGLHVLNVSMRSDCYSINLSFHT